ncbi:glycosyltransferase family 4 protein [Helicovermis profundi]|uniref:Glycosyltransferase family 4 protein n=1 Tax=Helicovermis profundi TaxID=3065157 RepID=A0AAU9E7G5_9FIRM|nr:glycosyltransferase family 4 protein [Clostridia bacterium S502]
MRILIINHFPLEGSGSGIYTKNLARELSEMGHKVKVIYPEHTKTESKSFDSRVILFKYNGNTDYDLDYNFPCFTSHPRSNNTYYDLTDKQLKDYVDTFVKVTKDEVEKFKPDIIHAQHLWIAPYAASLTNIPYIVTAHGTDLKGFVKDKRYHKYALEGAKNASKIITISNQVDEEVTKLYGIKSDKKALIQNGYDENLFLLKNMNKNKKLEEFGVNVCTEHVVSFAGKLTHFKGVDVLLKAAKIYEKEVEGNVITLIAGNGELYESLNNLRDKLNLEHIYFLGHINQEQLVDMYNIADVSTVPSRTEPFGLVAIEALACGTPVVGTNQGGLPDFITDKVGKLVPVDDDMALAEAIINELKRNDKFERSLNCSNYAKDNFSWKHSITEVENLYKKTIGIK